MTRRGVAVLVLSVLLVAGLAGCGENELGSNTDEDRAGKINVVATFYPMYDFAKKIGGNNVEVINLVPVGVDAHDWSPNPQDMVEIVNADVFLYHGAGFEMWIEPFLRNVEEGTVVVEASAGVDLLKVDESHDAHAHADHGHDTDVHADHDAHAHADHGHNTDAHADHDAHAHDDHHAHAHAEADAGGANKADKHDHGVYDPHVWISPKRALTLADNIRDGLIEADPERRSEYESNHADFVAQLEQLDRKLHEVVAAGTRDHIVVSHHAYAYLAYDYGFEQIAVMGLSPEAEPTPRELQSISEFIQDHDVQYILFEELASPRIAEMLSSDLGLDTLVFHPLEGLTDQQMADGEDYVSLMEHNIDQLAKALE